MNPRISFDVVNKSIGVKGVIDDPFTIFCELVNLNLEEKDLTTASDDESLLVDKIHVTKILVIDLLLIVVLFFFILWMILVGFSCFNSLITDNWTVILYLNWDSERLSLSIERVNLIVILVVVALLREIFLVAFKLNLSVVMNFLISQGFKRHSDPINHF